MLTLNLFITIFFGLFALLYLSSSIVNFTKKKYKIAFTDLGIAIADSFYVIAVWNASIALESFALLIMLSAIVIIFLGGKKNV